jgi:general secretion pathway protein D
VKGKVTVVSARPIPLESVYPVFLSVLQVNGFSALPSGAMVKIVPVVDAARTPGRSLGSGGAPADEVVTQVIELKNASAQTIFNALRPLLGINAHIAPVPGANVLVISDTQASLNRIGSIVERVDQASEGDVEVIALQHASAGEIVRVLTSLSAGQPKDAGSPPPAIVADERTNSVLIGGGRGDRTRLKTLVAHLDTPRDADGNTQVVYLRYANAENLAKILQGYASQSRSGTTGGTAAAPAAAAAGGTPPLEGVSVLAETETNALVITAAPRQMQQVRNIIDKLDIRRAQVLVEAIIVEMSAEKAAEMGITWAVDARSKGAVGLTNFPRVGPGLIQLGAAAGGSGAQAVNLIPDGMTLGVGRIDAGGGVSFAMLARALAGDGDTNILSTPSLLTLDNEEATFSAGQEVPFVTGQYTGTGGSNTPTNPFQTIERKDIGITLKIKPQINEGNAVFLTINQEVSSLGTSAVATVDAVTNKRTISTRVLANDGEIIVLGGLTDDQVQQSEQRVPVLGSIPGLGALFRYNKSSSVKRTLTIFLRPRIMHDADDIARFTESKYQQVRGQQTDLNKDGVKGLQGTQRPTLPEFDAGRAAETPAAAPATTPPPPQGGDGGR